MADKERSMYELEYPAPEVSGAHESTVTMVVALQGYADAGHAVEAAADHLLAALDNRLVASFNNDELIDYRSRRPTVTLRDSHIDRVDKLELGLRVLRDVEGHPFLLLAGPEPDLRWDGFSQAVADLAEKYGVDKTICLYSAPMAVPHTRPMVVSAHGNFPALKNKHIFFDSIVHLPGSAQLTIESVLQRRGKKTGGYTAMVPNYVSGSFYPEATLNLLRAVEDIANVKLPLHVLERDAEKVEEQLYQQTAENGEIQQVVGLLEQQYDERLAEFQEAHPGMALPGEAAIPTSEELGEEFERFLASVSDREAPPQPGALPPRASENTQEPSAQRTDAPGTTDPREALRSFTEETAVYPEHHERKTDEDRETEEGVDKPEGSPSADDETDDHQ